MWERVESELGPALKKLERVELVSSASPPPSTPRHLAGSGWIDAQADLPSSACLPCLPAGFEQTNDIFGSDAGLRQSYVSILTRRLRELDLAFQGGSAE